MKKYILPILASFLVFSIVSANFKPATLYTRTWDGIKKIVVKTQTEADYWFGEEYELYNEDILGASVTEILATDTLKDSRTTINDNFTALNNGKIEISTTTLPLITTLNGLASASSLATVGTITSGTWNATAIGVSKGGTGTTTPTSNQVMIGNGTSGLKVIGFGTSGQFLTSGGANTAPSWTTSSVDQGINYTWTGEHTFATTTIATSTITDLSAKKITLTATSTSGNSVQSKAYIDGKVTKLDSYTHTQTAASASTPGLTYTVFSKTGIGTMGVNDTMVIRGALSDDASSGNSTFKFNIGAGTATSTITWAKATDYNHITFLEIKIINRNSTDSQYITYLAVDESGTIVSGAQTATLDTTNSLYFSSVYSNSAQSELTINQEYFDAVIFKP